MLEEQLGFRPGFGTGWVRVWARLEQVTGWPSLLKSTNLSGLSGACGTCGTCIASVPHAIAGSCMPICMPICMLIVVDIEATRDWSVIARVFAPGGARPEFMRHCLLHGADCKMTADGEANYNCFQGLQRFIYNESKLPFPRSVQSAQPVGCIFW